LKNLILGPAYPLRGGIANFGEALCRAFRQAGKESSIISFYYQYPGFLFPGKTQFAEGPPPEDIPVTSLMSSVNPISWWRTVNHILREKPDYIIIQYWIPFMAPALGWIIRRMKKKSSIRVVSITHNVRPHEQRLPDRLLARYYFNSCDAFITLSRSSLAELKEIKPGHPAAFIPHPMYDHFGERVSREVALNHLNLPAQHKYLLFFGMIRKYKGLDLLYHALANEKLEKMNLKLIVAGEFYEEKMWYEKLADQLGIADRLVITDAFIPDEEVKYYFSVCDMVIQPYRSATQSGITQVAYHFNRPMLVTGVGGLPEIVPDRKVGYVTAIDPDAIAGAIRDFYDNRRMAAFEKNIEEEKKRFTWEAMVEGIGKLVERIQ
jgi:D-inositol-3-phosphate glycosyltransferase